MMVGITARQATSPTALIHGRQAATPPEATLFAPLDGAFNGLTAQLIASWKQE